MVTKSRNPDEQRKTLSVFHKSEVVVKNFANLHGKGLALYKLDSYKYGIEMQSCQNVVSLLISLHSRKKRMIGQSG